MMMVVLRQFNLTYKVYSEFDLFPASGIRLTSEGRKKPNLAHRWRHSDDTEDPLPTAGVAITNMASLVAAGFGAVRLYTEKSI